MIDKVIAAVIASAMIILSFSPLNFGMFYIFFRPLLQQYAMEGHTVFANIPLTGTFSLILVVYSLVVCIARKGYSLLPANVIFIYLLLLWSVISFINSIDPVWSTGCVLKILSAVALYSLIYNSIQTPSDARKVLYSIVLAAIVPMVIGYYQFIFAAGGRGLAGLATRVKGTLGMANAYGIFLSICFCSVMILLLRQEKRWHRNFLILILSSILVSTIIALNRGTWIALAVALLFGYVGYWSKVKARWIIICGVLLAVIFSGMVVQRFMQLKETEHWQRTNTLGRRIEMWKDVMRLIPQHPINGFGIGTAPHVYKRSYGDKAVPHNDYIRLFLEIGMPGLLLYLIFLFKELYRNIKLIFHQENWFVNFPVLVCVIYWIIISSVQNIVYHVVNFPLFLALIAVSRRWNELFPIPEKGQS